MAENKTQRNDGDVDTFLASIVNPTRRDDARAVCGLMAELTGEEPAMWGPAIIGFGDQHYKYASGREGDWFVIGLSPRKQALSIYVTDGLERHADLLAQLGKHKTGVGCLYINKLEDVDTAVLRRLLAQSVAGVDRRD